MSLASNPSQHSLKVVPFTPIRRLLWNFTRPIHSLGKRNRESTDSTSSGAASPTTSFPPLPLDNEGDFMFSSPIREERAERARLALQKEDTTLNAVVVTTLPIYPFCCHEDLIMMSRQQLVDVAAVLNNHLPAALKIEVSEDFSQAQIRHAIEILVGIIPETPAAPKAVRSWPIKRSLEPKEALRPALVLEDDIDHYPSSISPLATRMSRRRDLSLINSTPGTRPLETDEGNLLMAKRPLKKRKVSHDQYTPRFVYSASSGECVLFSPMVKDDLDSGQREETLFSSPTERRNQRIKGTQRQVYGSDNRFASPLIRYGRVSAFNFTGAGDGTQKMDVI